MKQQTKRISTQTLTFGAILTALVVILQFLAIFLRGFLPFALSLVLVPVVIGAAKCGPYMGAWLGLVFGVVVLLSGDAASFYAINPFGTVLTVLVKGFACGLAAGLVYRLLVKKNNTVAVYTAAVVCPLVNTGVFSPRVCHLFLGYRCGVGCHGRLRRQCRRICVRGDGRHQFSD